MERTYVPFWDWKEKSKQTEYTESTPLLNADGTLNAKGWARHNVFEYDRNLVKTGIMSRKEWDFYQVSDGKYMVQLSFANITIGGYVAAKLIDIANKKLIAENCGYHIGRFIYLADAFDDILQDEKSGNYNPFILQYGNADAVRANSAIITETLQDSLNACSNYYALAASEPLQAVDRLIFNIVELGGRSAIKKITERKDKNEQSL